MQLELRDLSNDASVLIPEAGTTFGREGGGADVMLKDGGVSKRHARVFADGGAWFIEDLGSSNGTYLQTAKLQGITELMPGDVFSMSKMKFEVVQVLEESGSATRAAPPEEPDELEAPPKPGKRPGAPPENSGVSARGKGNTAPPAGKKPAGKPGASQDESRSGARAPKEQASKGNVAPKNAPRGSAGGEGAAAKGVGEVLAAMPKALAYYLVNVPLMLLNPIGTVRKGIEEQPQEPMGRIELIAWALPGQLFGAALGFLASLIRGIVRGPLSIGDIIPVTPLLIAVVGSVVSGFLWHPVLEWIITKLKGSSDERSRTNYFLAMQTATVLLPIPAAIGILLSIIPVPLLQIVPLVLGLGTTLITSYVALRWMQHFGVLKWIPIVILVLGGVACVTTVRDLVGTVRAQFSGGGGAVAVGDGVPSGQAVCDALSGEAKEACLKGQAAAEEARKNGEAAAKAAEEAVAQAGEPKPPDAKPPEPKKPGKKDPPVEVAAVEPAPAEPTPAAKVDPPPAKAPTGKGYGSFAAKRDAVEKRITEDPTLLRSVSGLEELYRNYSEDVYEVDSKYGKLNAKRPQDRRLNEHLREAELYEKADKKVADLYGKLFK